MKLQILRINEDNTLYRLCKSILYIQGRFGVQAGGVDCYIKHLINNRNFFKKDITKKSVYIQIQITSYINIRYSCFHRVWNNKIKPCKTYKSQIKLHNDY